MRHAPAVSLAVGLALITHLAVASPVTEERHRLASESFRQAQAAFGRREYAAAAAAFEQAARFEPHPSPLLDAEEAWERAGEPVHAAEDCDRVASMSGVDATFLGEAQRRLKALATKVSTIDVQGPRTTVVRIDDGAEVALPLHRRLPPGKHELAIADARSSHPRTMTIDLVAGEVRVIDAGAATPEDADAHDTPARDRPSESEGQTAVLAPGALVVNPIDPAGSGSASTRRVPLLTWVALGTSAAATATAIGFGAATVSAKRSYAAVPSDTAADAFQRDKIVTNVAWGVAAAAAITAVVVWFVMGDAPRSPPRAASRDE